LANDPGAGSEDSAALCWPYHLSQAQPRRDGYRLPTLSIHCAFGNCPKPTVIVRLLDGYLAYKNDLCTFQIGLIIQEEASQALLECLDLPRAQSNLVFPIGSATGKTISILRLFAAN
jgi:hypothetical protein